MAAKITYQRANNGLNFIFVEGDLEYGDEKQFQRLAIELDDALVIFSSYGGSLKAGLEIGKAIRLKGFSTFVTDNDFCASACALAWLGGQKRLMSTTSKIGFHGAYIEKGGERVTTSAGNALVGAYLSQLGLAERAIIYITQANPDTIKWLTLEDANSIGISVRPLNLADANSKPISKQPSTQITLEQRAIAFYADVQNIWSQPNSVAIPKLSHLYEAYITFYGNTKTNNEVVNEKINFVNRWVDRNYAPVPGSVSVTCNQNTDICNISGVIGWTTYNNKNNTVSRGTAELELGVRFTTGNPKIFYENGRVLSRQITKQ